jgi:hypothetical protein
VVANDADADADGALAGRIGPQLADVLAGDK